MRSLMIAAIAALGLSGPALAQDAATINRFRLEKTEGGFVRLDQQTGAITFCREQNGELTCRMAADERAAYERELDVLAKRVDALEARTVKGTQMQGLPSDAEVEQSLSIIERFMRRFMGIAREFQGQDHTGPARN
jgi:hypothetical protein